MEKYPGLRDKVTQVCVAEEYELCVEQHVIHRMISVWRGFERQYILSGNGGTADNAVLQKARELTIKCLTFKLEFESTGLLTVEFGGGYKSTVTSEITLRFNPDDSTNSGDAPLVNDIFEFFMPSPCVVTSTPGSGGTFKAFQLIPLDVPDEALGHVSDFILSYLPGNTSESAAFVCNSPGGGGSSGSIPAFPAWTSTFLATHQDEVDILVQSMVAVLGT